MEKLYKAIFFDWDGTAVLTRKDPSNEIIPVMTKLLEKGINLFIISGTTYENISGGRLHEKIPKNLLKNLYLGLGRGAYNYGFDNNGNIVLLYGNLPDMELKIKIHSICFEIHKELLSRYGYETDIVFSRPNYCKIDLLVDLDRKDKLYLQPDEIDIVSMKLREHGYQKGIKGLIDFASELGQKAGIKIKATTDAKYLEVGISTKSDNVDTLLDQVVFKKGIDIKECCFWGDEFTFLGDEIQGSDAYMITEKSVKADFFDVSESPLGLPPVVKHVGGGVERFREFLESQI